MDREHSRDVVDNTSRMSFSRWLWWRCAIVAEAGGHEVTDVQALSEGLLKRACSFKSMTSYGSHYRVDVEEAAMEHVTFDARVAELRADVVAANVAQCGAAMQIVRVGILKEILVLNYGHLIIVLMVVSWVAKDTETEPRLRRDAH